MRSKASCSVRRPRSDTRRPLRSRVFKIWRSTQAPAVSMALTAEPSITTSFAAGQPMRSRRVPRPAIWPTVHAPTQRTSPPTISTSASLSALAGAGINGSPAKEPLLRPSPTGTRRRTGARNSPARSGSQDETLGGDDVVQFRIDCQSSRSYYEPSRFDTSGSSGSMIAIMTVETGQSGVRARQHDAAPRVAGPLDSTKAARERRRRYRSTRSVGNVLEVLAIAR